MKNIMMFSIACLSISSHLFAESSPQIYLMDRGIYKTDTSIYKRGSHSYTDPGGLPREKLTCEVLVTRSFSFGALVVPSYCNDAIRACIIEDLMKNKSSLPFKSAVPNIPANALEEAKKQVDYNVSACQLIVDAHHGGYRDINSLLSF